MEIKEEDLETSEMLGRVLDKRGKTSVLDCGQISDSRSITFVID